MINAAVPFTVGVLALLISITHSEVTSHDNGFESALDTSESASHHLQKRNAPTSLSEEDDTLRLTSHGLLESPASDDIDKRGSLFRFGKRQGSLFRFGKRGSLFRFGKRGERQGGALFRFGKRAGTIFRFGRSGSMGLPLESSDDKAATVRKYDGLEDEDLLSEILAHSSNNKGLYYLDDLPSKREIDSFHWGSDSSK